MRDFNMTGWIKLHRKFLEWEWFDIADMVKLFIFLLLNTNTKPKVWHGNKIRRGQYLTSLNTLQEKTGLSRQNIRTCLRRLEETEEINTLTNTRYTLITICKYEDYQLKTQSANTPTNTPLTHDQHTANTNIRIKELKEGKNKGLNFDFSILEFNKVWIEWIGYKWTSHKFKYKDSNSERAGIKKLLKLSNSNMGVAREIIENSMANGYSGFFELEKPKQNGTPAPMNAGEDYKFN